jgi:hypothetical protein
MAKVAFLSARNGFREAITPIADYDARLTPDLAARMIAGGMTTRWPRPPLPQRPDNYGMHPGAEIASMSSYCRRPFDDVALVGGHLYLDVMRAFLKEFIRMNASSKAPGLRRSMARSTGCTARYRIGWRTRAASRYLRVRGTGARIAGLHKRREILPPGSIGALR